MSRHIITPLYACSFELTHEYQARYDALAADGYRLVTIDGYRSQDELRYAGIWIRDQGAVLSRARHGLTSNEYQTAFDDLNRRGYRLTGLTGLSSAQNSASATFAPIWNDGSWHGHHARHDMTSTEYQTTFEQYAADGYQKCSTTPPRAGSSAT